ncbi:MAG: hypothetical protein JNK82_10870 [Myxococcaceae bacterium]|nr:hypothetical protein [Myxococcaceae bacterium]
MVRSALVLMSLMVAAPAWAVGERVALPKGLTFSEQLKETLCISMECGSGVDATVTAKVIKGNKAEIKVLSPAGVVKATVTAPLDEEGRLSSMDLVAATSGIIQGIEGTAKAAEAPAPAPAAKVAKGSKASKKSLASKLKSKKAMKFAAKARGNHPRG